MTQLGNKAFTYDTYNRMITAVDSSVSPAMQAQYQYDSMNRRISKTVDSSTIRYCYDGGQIIAEYDGANTLLRRFVYGPGIDEPICMIAYNSGGTETGRYFYHYDGQGNIVGLSNSSGNLVEQYKYDVYGLVTIYDGGGTPLTQSACGNPYYFTGRELDNETGLYYYRARMYEPQLGRFMQPDPIGYADGMNLYAYCGNNPVNFIDPWGLCGEDEDSGFGDYMDELFTWPWNIGNEAFEMEGEEYGDYADPFQGDYRHAAAAAMAARGYGLIPSGLFLLYHQRSESDPNDAAAEWRGWRNAWLHPFTSARKLGKGLTRRPIGPKKPMRR